MKLDRCVRIVAVAGLAAASLLTGMCLRPQDAAARTPASERYEAAKEVWSTAGTLSWRTMTENAAEVEARVLWSRRLAEAATDAGALPPKDAFAQHVARMEQAMEEAKSLYEAGRRSGYDVAVVRYALAEAKGLLERVAK